MKAAGLTHGGFYKHFESKDQLVAEACAEAVEAMIETMTTAAPAGRRSRKRISRPVTGTIRPRDARSPRSAASSAGADEKTRAVATEGFLKLVDIMAGQFGKAKPADAQAAGPGGGIDDDRRPDDVADRDRPRVVGGDTPGGEEELEQDMRGLSLDVRMNKAGRNRPGTHAAFS